MLKILISGFIFIFFISNEAMACEIHSYPRIIRSDHLIIHFNDIVKKSNCSKDIKSKFLKIIQNSKGVIHNHILKEEFKAPIHISPKKITVISLEENLKKHYGLSSGWSFKETSFIGNKTAIVLRENESLSSQCQDCSGTGLKNIKLKVSNPIQGSQHFYWIKSTLLIKTLALISNTNQIVNNKPLNHTSFKFQEVYSKRPEQFFVNKERLKYYKLNKSLRKNGPIIYSSISPVSLIKTGQPATIVMKNKGLSLLGKAIPLKNGFYGDTIQLRSIHSKKIIIGKVIGFNKVVIEL